MGKFGLGESILDALIKFERFIEFDAGIQALLRVQPLINLLILFGYLLELVLP